MPLRILHVISQIGLGGCELQLLELCRRHDPARWHLGVFYYAPNPDNMVDEFTRSGVELFYVNKFSMSLPSFLLGMAGVIRQFRPDVIHTWQRSPNLWGRAVGLACGCTRLVASDRTMRPQYDSLFWPAVEMLLVPFTIRLGNSWAVARHVQKLLSLPRQRLRVIHNAVDLPDRDRQADRADVRKELHLPDEQKLVLTVGRLYQAKDYPTLFRAAAEIVPHRPDVTFLCAGHGAEQDALAQLHRQMGLGDRLHLLGLRRDVPRLMSAADVFCLPSQWEGFPNALAEAMASGLPAISTAFKGAREIVRDGQTGLVVPVGDHRAVASAIMRLLSDDALRSSLALAGRQWVREHLSWPRLLGEMDSLYRSLVKGKPVPEFASAGRLYDK